MAELNLPIEEGDIVEPRFITHLSKKEVGEDVHIVRELITKKDGRKIDNIRIIKNYRRPFWVTKPIYRDHDEKKESEELAKVDMFLSTESDLAKNIAPRLGDRYQGITDLGRLKDSPYLYGIDVDSRTFLKYSYIKKYGGHVTPYRVGTFDIEVNVKTNEIIVATFATPKKVSTYLLKSFIKGIPNPVERIKDTYDKHIPEHSLGNPELDIRIFDNEVDLLKAIFKTANEADVDFMAIWNLDYDIPTIVERLEHFGVKPEDVFHYEKIPEKYKFFKYKQGKKQKVTESGKVIPINPEEQWHTVKTTSNFYIIDAMSAHRYVRVGGKNVPGGYSLDNILKYEGVAKKLKFDTDEGVKGIEWHIHMVENKPIEYVVYNIWDAMSMLELDKKTKDLELAVPILCDISHFDVFNSGPKKLVDGLEFFYLTRKRDKRVLGVRPNKVDSDKLLGLGDWIVTMPGYRIRENGLKVLEEAEHIHTNIRSFVYDSDAVSSYPSATKAANVSKDTTHREIIAIEGIEIPELKKQNINMLYGKTNAVEWCSTMLNFPSLYELEVAV